ncbi:GIY-YIG nuclease family protein [Burkholderia sp. Bp9090]|uniref:GIY-YIG nuclease family protein n=1 Tax=Burkholderia sp. Bp9090 TaxID=2184567 RepID=UPI000F5E6F72|nr:GIY-YIG nuclease family protein [Burkholderia sp. Bp9090]RQZ26274.1 GIY-YIG nuclease family protein [Burkholderia sp. Bp9090]
MSWFLYLIECADDSVYTGITTDVAARFDEHASGKGARYTRSRKPRAVLASFPLPDRSIASRAEYWVKRLTAAQKRELAAGLRTLESVLPAVVTIDGEVDADGLKAGTRRRKKVKKAPQPAEITMQAAETEQPVKKAAKAGSDGKAPRSGKTSKSGQSAQARAKTKAAPASKRATNGDAAEVKKASSRSTAAKQDKPAVNSTPKRKAPAAGGKSVAKARAGSASTSPGRRGTSAAGKARTEAVEAAAPATTERGATGAIRSTDSTRAKRTKTSPNAGSQPAPARTRKNTTTGAKPRTKQNRAAS